MSPFPSKTLRASDREGHILWALPRILPSPERRNPPEPGVAMGQGAEPWVPWAGRGFRLGEAVKGVGLGSVRFGLGRSASREPCDFSGAVFCPKTAGTQREGGELPRLPALPATGRYTSARGGADGGEGPQRRERGRNESATFIKNLLISLLLMVHHQGNEKSGGQ